MLYQHELGGSGLDEVLSRFSLAEMVLEGDADGAAAATLPAGNASAAQDYAEDLVRGVAEHRDEVDSLIREHAVNWRLERMPVVDRAILRVAVYELLYQTDIPRVVILDEAIELAKLFGSEQSSAFVNGVLDGLIHTQELPGELH